MKTVAIIQTRMGSSRLPGKVLMDLGGATMLARVVERVRAAKSIDEIVIATTKSHADDAIVREAKRLGATPFRGSESDVLSRYLGAACETGADRIVRVTSDCPLLDPSVVDAVVAECAGDVDYASNTHRRTYPRGLDVEAFHRDTLERIGRMGTSAPAREHVTAFVVERPELFEVRDVVANHDDSDLRWTVDAPDDLALVRTLYDLMDLRDGIRPYAELVEAVRARPGLVVANAHVIQKVVRVA
jgi:spore coat polysaccharide biosynthesis protein SpsF